MSAPFRLAAFAALLAVVFGAAVAIGSVGEPDPIGRTADTSSGHAEAEADGEASGHAETEAEGDDHAQTAAPDASQAVRGLAVSADGLTLRVDDTELRAGATERLRFAIQDDAGRTVEDFDVEHTKRMHVIVVRRDLTGFQHLHPEQASDGGWELPVRLDEPGSYRLFADFSRDGEPHTLATDLAVDGAADLSPLPPARPAERSDGGYHVALSGTPARAGEEAELRFDISRDGQPVDTEPYLGAGGHLVALRAGDLGFLHVHPVGDDPTFAVTFPTAGTYRLFLQFQHEGRVETVAFTQEVRR